MLINTRNFLNKCLRKGISHNLIYRFILETTMKRLLTLLALPFLFLHLIMRFFSSRRIICMEDQRHTAQCRMSVFQNTILQFVYFMLWLPEYRSVFYMRCGKIGKIMPYLPPPIASKNIVYQNVIQKHRRWYGN